MAQWQRDGNNNGRRDGDAMATEGAMMVTQQRQQHGNGRR